MTNVGGYTVTKMTDKDFHFDLNLDKEIDIDMGFVTHDGRHCSIHIRGTIYDPLFPEKSVGDALGLDDAQRSVDYTNDCLGMSVHDEPCFTEKGLLRLLQSVFSKDAYPLITQLLAVLREERMRAHSVHNGVAQKLADANKRTTDQRLWEARIEAQIAQHKVEKYELVQHVRTMIEEESTNVLRKVLPTTLREDARAKLDEAFEMLRSKLLSHEF